DAALHVRRRDAQCRRKPRLHVRFGCRRAAGIRHLRVSERRRLLRARQPHRIGRRSGSESSNDDQPRRQHVVHRRQHAIDRAADARAVSSRTMTSRTSTAVASLSALLLASWSVTTAAQTRAVDTLNFEAGVESIDSDTSGSTSNGTLGLNLRGTLPLGSFFGASMEAGYSESRVRTREVVENEDGTLSGIRPSCNFDHLGGEVSLFARRPTLGRIGVSYGIGRLGSDCSETSFFLPHGKDSLDSDRVRFDVELYWRSFTIGASHTTLSLDDAPEIETTTITGSWYPLESLRLSLYGSDLYEEDTYGLSLEHQPQFLGDGFGVQLSYAKTDAEPGTRTITLG